MYDAAIAIKDTIEPMFDNAIMTAATSYAAAGSDSDKDWIRKARQVHSRPGHHSMISAQSNHDTNAPICALVYRIPSRHISQEHILYSRYRLPYRER